MNGSRTAKKLAAREIEICARLKEARGILRLSQKEAGAQIGISRERLASYEDARVPLRWDIALKFCRQFVFSERWLALGEDGIELYLTRPGDKYAYEPVDRETYKRLCASLAVEPVVHQLKPGALFSEVFDAALDRLYTEVRCKYFLPRIEVLYGDHPQMSRHYFDFVIGEKMKGLNALQIHRWLISLAETAKMEADCVQCGGLTEQEEQRLVDAAIEKKIITWREDPTYKSRNISKRLSDYLGKEAKHYLESLNKIGIEAELKDEARLARMMGWILNARGIKKTK